MIFTSSLWLGVQRKLTEQPARIIVRDRDRDVIAADLLAEVMHPPFLHRASLYARHAETKAVVARIQCRQANAQVQRIRSLLRRLIHSSSTAPALDPAHGSVLESHVPIIGLFLQRSCSYVASILAALSVGCAVLCSQSHHRRNIGASHSASWHCDTSSQLMLIVILVWHGQSSGGIS